MRSKENAMYRAKHSTKNRRHNLLLLPTLTIPTVDSRKVEVDEESSDPTSRLKESRLIHMVISILWKVGRIISIQCQITKVDVDDTVTAYIEQTSQFQNGESRKQQ